MYQKASNLLIAQKLISYKDVLVGECKFIGKHILLRTDKQINVYKVDKILNERAIKLERDIIGKP